MILVGDIGGTKTNVALLETDGRDVGPVLAEQKFRSADYESLEKIVAAFLDEHQAQVTHACFGVAGPVVDEKVATPNLAWVVSARALATLLGLEGVRLLNDLEATAHGIETLKPAQLHTLNEGEFYPEGNRALIAAGTGLGMAGLFRQGGRYHPMASEGGHTDFAPRTGLQIELLEYLLEKLGKRVSYERTLSGPGLYNIYCFLRDRRYAEEPDWLAAQLQAGDKTAAVSVAALSQKSELAVKTLDLFAEIYGAMAGNLALLMMATGGLYVGGGIAPKIIEKLKDGTFMSAFKDKGRLSPVVAGVPVHVILDDKTALYGAARCAVNQDKA